jgi:N-acetylneuraminic acid mutarotase
MYSLDLPPAADSSAPEWKVIEAAGDKPSERVAHSQAVVGDSIYVFGGRQGTTMDEKPLNDLWRFDTTTSSWSLVVPKDASKVPAARSFHTMASVDNRYLYIFAGCAAVGRLNDLHRFDTVEGEWEQMPSSDAIEGRGGPCFINDGKGSLYVVAGFAGRETNDIHRFDIASKKWSQCSDAGLRPRSVCAHCNAGDKVVIFGGEVDPSEKGHAGAGAFADDSLLFDPKSNQISTLPASGPPPRGWSSMASCADGRVVLFAGLTGDDEKPERLNDLWVLSDVCQ